NLFTNSDDSTRNLSLDVAIDGFTHPGTILVFASTDGVSRKVLIGSHVLPPNLWSQLAVTVTDRTVKLYVNGEFDSELDIGAQIHPTALPVYLGSAYGAPGRTYYPLDGQLAAVEISTVALTANQVRLAYAARAVTDPGGGSSLP